MRAIVLVLLAACGRSGFDARTSDGAVVRDTAPDTARDAAIDTPRDGAALCSGLYCDDFEAPSLDARWMLDIFHGTIDLDTAHAHSGVQSVHTHTDAIVSSTNDARAVLLSYDQLPVTGTIYVRIWIYRAGAQPTGFFDQTINLADAPGNGMSTGAKDGFMANNDYTTPTQYTQSAITAEPIDRWACLMFSMPSGITGTSRVWLDGTELTDIAQTVTSAQPAPTHVYLGTEWVGTPMSQPAADAWIDDVELSTQPVSCN